MALLTVTVDSTCTCTCTDKHTVLWSGGVVVGTSDGRTHDCGFKCQLVHCHVTIVDKLFTHLCLSVKPLAHM